MSLTEERKAQIAQSFFDVRERMRIAGATDEVCLLAATKHVSAEEINFAIDTLGLTHIGENRVQELLEKYQAIHRQAVQIHFIGTLQSNKVKHIVGKVALIHSLDSLSLAREIEKQAAKQGIVQDVLVEINICEEASKSGILLAELPQFLQELTSLAHVRVCGLMTMGQKDMDEVAYRAHFTRVREIWEELRAQGHKMAILSMGMSDSYEIAITSGSTMVRVGTALFGARTYQA